MKRAMSMLTAAAALCGALLWPAGAEPFSRYEIILIRKPFGESLVAPETPEKPRENWAQHLRLHGIYELRTRMGAGIADSQSKENYYVSEGDTILDGVEVTSIDFANQKVVLEKDNEVYELALEGEARAVSAQEQAQQLARFGIKPSRRRKLAEPKPPEPPPKYTGEDLKRHLMEYNMELIRAQGELGPALPIPLSPEDDAQLVREGVLPPLSEDQQGGP